jgi:transcriptional regulator
MIMATAAEIQLTADCIRDAALSGALTERKIKILDLLATDVIYLQIARELKTSEANVSLCLKTMRADFQIPESRSTDRIVKRNEERISLITAWLLYKKQAAEAA